MHFMRYVYAEYVRMALALGGVNLALGADEA
jgi:hypothetical protein